jgi:hypothetical protein
MGSEGRNYKGGKEGEREEEKSPRERRDVE